MSRIPVQSVDLRRTSSQTQLTPTVWLDAHSRMDTHALTGAAIEFHYTAPRKPQVRKARRRQKYGHELAGVQTSPGTNADHSTYPTTDPGRGRAYRVERIAGRPILFTMSHSWMW